MYSACRKLFFSFRHNAPEGQLMQVSYQMARLSASLNGVSEARRVCTIPGYRGSYRVRGNSTDRLVHTAMKIIVFIIIIVTFISVPSETV